MTPRVRVPAGNVLFEPRFERGSFARQGKKAEIEGRFQARKNIVGDFPLVHHPAEERVVELLAREKIFQHRPDVGKHHFLRRRVYGEGSHVPNVVAVQKNVCGQFVLQKTAHGGLSRAHRAVDENKPCHKSSIPRPPRKGKRKRAGGAGEGIAPVRSAGRRSGALKGKAGQTCG